MINIRHQVFETNSSSTHSVSISDNVAGLLDTIFPKNGVIYLTGGEFGWEWLKYNLALDKANYAAVFAKGNSLMTDMLISVIKQHTGAKEVIINLGDSCIDHQSSRFENGQALEAFVSTDTLKNWIFNPESYLFLGNDNEETPPNFYDVEFGIDYTHQLSLEGCPIVEKFESYPDKELLIQALERLAFQHPSCKRYPISLEIVNYELYLSDGSLISSFDEVDNGYLKIFRVRPCKIKKGGDFQGYEIVEMESLKFTIDNI